MDKEDVSLFVIWKGILFLFDGLCIYEVDQLIWQWFNFFYVKDYNMGKDMEICWNVWCNLGCSIVL